MISPGIFALAGSALSAAAPVDPDADEARDLILRELSKPEYEAARPNWFDRAAGAVWDWITSLEFGGASGPPALGLVVVLGGIAVALVVAFLVFGMPRLRRRSSLEGALFGAEDARTAPALRAAAEQLAADGDFTGAIAEMFRAIARDLSERSILSTSPGTTARDFARRAAVEFPDLTAPLTEAAAVFDDVRYLGRVGTAGAWQSVVALEEQLRTARPLKASPPQRDPVSA